MGIDQYKVDVLHYVNPHLMWVLVRKDEHESAFYFEQIGIYGILPQNVSFGVDCVLKTEPCEQWMPAASVAMNKCLVEAAEVWFSPTYIDQKSSIFDDNTHKYGDLRVIKKNGDELNVRQEIINSDFGYEDDYLFLKELRDFNLKTELNYIALKEVMRKIEQAYKNTDIPKNTWLNALKSQISVDHEGKLIETAMAARKLEVPDRDNIDTLLKNKLNVLKLCKDVDEVSLGRACNLKKSSMSNRSSVVSVALKKKLEWLESQSIVNRSKLGSKPEADKKNNNSVNQHPNTDDVDGNTNDIHPDMKPKGDASEYEQNKNMVFSKKKNNLNAADNNTDFKKGSKPDSPVKEKTKLVGFGPAGLELNKFRMKEHIISDEQPETAAEEPRKPEPEPEFQVTKSEDVYANADSEVNLKISNLDLLKRIKSNNSIQNNSGSNKQNNKGTALSAIRRKVKYLEEKQAKLNVSISSVSDKDSSKCDLDSDNESITDLEKKIGLNKNKIKKPVNLEQQLNTVDIDEKRPNVNPFKNIDGSISIFVDKLVSPVLMVHTKKNNRIEPVSVMRDIPFGDDIHIVLRNMGVQRPMRPQTVAWPTILRGHSFFLVGPYNSGNTMGYLPAVCRLVNDFKNTPNKFGLSTIIVCGTSHSVASVESMCKMFLHSAKIFACFAGMSDLHITTSLLNGCDLLICTPSMLVRLIQEDFSLDFRSLSTLVIDDCEHISSIYPKELKFCLLKVMDIVKNRANKEFKVQYVIVSRIWCDFMSSLAKKAPDSVICISAFQECVLYSKAATSVDFVAQENKLTKVTNFMEGVDRSKKTVIVCRADAEVKLIEKALSQLNYVVFSCDSTMTVQDLYNLDKTLRDYEEPVSGPILVCCDGNLTHMNVTDANYLIHYSLPDLFSTFCKRFAVLIDNYSSIYKSEESSVKIKILFDDNNIEQLPKILHFLKRCTQDVPPFLDEISASVLNEKYLKKAQNLVPVCRRLLTLGKCPDFWNCIERHAIFKEHDSSKPWVPQEGVITFQMLHYHSAVYYSGRITSSSVNNNVTKYANKYSLLSIKLGMYYSKEANRKLHGIPKVGDVCAVTLKQNLFVRCQVAKVLDYVKGQPTFFLIKLIDEEKYETAHDTSLYYLPDELKEIETHVVTVVLTNLIPQDKDVTFSKLAENQLRRITDGNDDVYMRGHITMVVGNTILVDKLEACQDLSYLEEIVVKSDFRKELLDGHAIPNPYHIDNLRKVCDYKSELPKEQDVERIEAVNPVKTLPAVRWAHLESGGFSSVFFMCAENPSQFFLRPFKFDQCMTTLIEDIRIYLKENPKPIENIEVGMIVLAEFPDDTTYERARIESNVNNNKVKCFFVDQGEWREVSPQKIYPITEKIITKLPFQAIECRLVGVKPPGDSWTDFSTNFFADSCYDSGDNLKQLFTKYFTKEKAEFTGGHKYGVVLIDTYSDEDIIINQMMIDKNLAVENEEIDLLNDLGFERQSEGSSDSEIDEAPSATAAKADRSSLVNASNQLTQYIPTKTSNRLISSTPLVDSDIDSDDFEFVADDSGNLGSIAISEVVSIVEVPGTERSVASDNKAKASPIENSAPPTASDDKAKASSIDDTAPQTTISPKISITSESRCEVSKPKVEWRQDKNTVTLKIRLTVDTYHVTIQERYIEFYAENNNIIYGFDFELYGVVDLSKCSHCNKGLYIEIKLSKLKATKWLTLTRHNDKNKWIVYNMDNIDVSSDEESEVFDYRKNLVKNEFDSDSDDNLQDDVNFSY